MFFKDGSRAQILEALVYTVSRGDGIVKVTGEVGSGKTMLLRLLATRLPSSTEIIYINSPNLSSKDILLYICSELQIDVSKFKEKFSLTNALKNKLVELHSNGHKVVMLIDEAQVMTFDALEEVRLLSNLETSDDKLLQMVLFGQPELDVALENDKVRQIKSRISYSIYVPALTKKEVHTYLNYRMRQAGYKGLDIFSVKVSNKIHKLSLGLPRNINVIADKLLMASFGLGTKQIKSSHFKHLPDHSKSNLFQTKYFFFLMLFSFLTIIFLVTYSLFLHNKNVIEFFSDQGSIQESSMNRYPEEDISQEAKPQVLMVEKNQTKEFENNSQPKSGVVNESLVEKDITSSSDAKKLQNVPSDGNIIASEVNITNKTPNYNDKETLQNDLNDNDSGGFQTPLPQELVINDLKEPFYSMNKRGALKALLQKHRKSKEWLLRQDKRYVIQLSTRNINSLEMTLRFYERNGFDFDKLHILIDFNTRIEVYRIKVFYSLSDSFSELSKELNSLPRKVRKEGPYIIKLETLKKVLQRTEENLKNVGIINE